MPTTPSDPSRSRRAALAAALVLVLAGCSPEGDPPAPRSAPQTQPERTERRVVEAPDVTAGLRQALTRRARAVRLGDREAFLAGVDGRDDDFAQLQATYFDNLATLPVQELRYRLVDSSLVREGRGYWAEVDVSLQLEDYDAVPVVTRHRFRFTSPRRGRFTVAATRDPAWEADNNVSPQPWETGPVTVVAGSSVLGIFDSGSAGQAGAVMADAQAGVAAVRGELPFDWDGRVVVYGLSDPEFLAGVDGLPGDDPLSVDAVSFPVPERPGSTTVASTRFVLNPLMVARPGPARQRLIRHELTHVALGERQAGVPTWFSEGLAEYISVRPMAPAARAIPNAALDAAEDGLSALPADDEFSGAPAEVSYGVAWWACEYLATTYDESMLWVLLEAMRDPLGGDDVLTRVLDTTEATVARKAGRLMLDTYRPPPDKEKPEPSPEPSEDPSDGPSGAPEEEPADESSGDSSLGVG